MMCLEESGGIRYKCGYKYQLVEAFTIATPFAGFPLVDTNYYRLSPDGMLTLKVLYAWDGPSGPALDTRDTMIGSLVHDALCQMMNEGLLPRECHRAVDEFFNWVNKRAGMWKPRRWYFLRAVRINAKLRLVGPEREHEIRYKRGVTAGERAVVFGRLQSYYRKRSEQ